MLQFFKALGQIVRVLVQTHDEKDDMFIQSLIRLDSQHHNYETRDCQDLLLMEEILHQLIGTVVYPIIYKVLYIPGGAGFLPSTVSQTGRVFPMANT